MGHIGCVGIRDSRRQKQWLQTPSTHLLHKREEILRPCVPLHIGEKKERGYLRERFIEENKGISKERRSHLLDDLAHRRGKFIGATFLHASVEPLVNLQQCVLHNVQRAVVDNPSHGFKHYVSSIPVAFTFLSSLRLIFYVFFLQHFIAIQKRLPKAELRNLKNDGPVFPNLHRIIHDDA